MIQNDREYQVAKEQAARLMEALTALPTDVNARPHIHPRLQEAERHGIEDLLDRVDDEIAEYEAVIKGTRAVIYIRSLEELPTALIKGRKMAGLSEADVASRVGISRELYCDHEQSGFAAMGFELLTNVARALNVSVREPLALGVSVSEEWSAELQTRLRSPFERAAVADVPTHD